jgi:hypothetical protein
MQRKKIEMFLYYKIMSSNTHEMSLIEPSICIPRTLANVTWFQVKNTFEQLMGKGTVERVDIVSKNMGDNDPFCRIFVHFRYWPNTPEMIALRNRLVAGETIKIVYDNPWFWKCAASRIPKPERTTPRAPPYIMFDEATTRTTDLPVTTHTDKPGCESGFSNDRHFAQSPLPRRPRATLTPLELVHSGAPEPDEEELRELIAEQVEQLVDHPVVGTYSDS